LQPEDYEQVQKILAGILTVNHPDALEKYLSDDKSNGQ
jgi:hypothetical protein